jgi:hypothetical protein
VDTFRKYWTDVPIRAYTDDDLERLSEWLPEFKLRHRGRPTDNYRFDAVRFAHKVAAIELAYRLGHGDVLVWIDADCVTHVPVDAEWLAGLLGDADFAYLKRTNKYPEMGFFLMRRCEATCELLRRLVSLYVMDDLFKLDEWHDSWAIEHVRKGLELEGALKCASLSGAYESTGHPFVNGPLGEKLDHCKGKRKALGKSKPSDLKASRTEEYWRHG